MYTHETVILRGNRYQLTSYGNGAAYLLQQRDGATLWFDGDTAGTFRETLDGLEQHKPHAHVDDILEELWDEYDGAAIIATVH